MKSWFNKEDIDILTRPITIEETKSALDSMGDSKAPGPNGFNALFYKKYWNIVVGKCMNLSRTRLSMVCLKKTSTKP